MDEFIDDAPVVEVDFVSPFNQLSSQFLPKEEGGMESSI